MIRFPFVCPFEQHMFNEMRYSVFRGGFIAGTCIYNQSAMGDHSRQPVMYKSYTVVEGVKKEFHYLLKSGSKCTITVKRFQIEIFYSKFCFNGFEIYICSPKRRCHSSVGRATD